MFWFIGRLILMPLGIFLAAFCTLLFLGFVGMVQPGIAEAIATTAHGTVDRMFRTFLEGEEAIMRFGWSLVILSRFVMIVLILPVSLVAVVAEFFGFRAYLFHALGVALLTAALPFAFMPELLSGFTYASRATGLLAGAGALAGTIYWIVAGRSAGFDPKTVEERATAKAPAARR
jgi:hypothetical protein